MYYCEAYLKGKRIAQAYRSDMEYFKAEHPEADGFGFRKIY